MCAKFAYRFMTKMLTEHMARQSHMILKASIFVYMCDVLYRRRKVDRAINGKRVRLSSSCTMLNYRQNPQSASV
jgi:hypothetical protein